MREVLEPLVVVTLLAGGVILNRNSTAQYQPLDIEPDSSTRVRTFFGKRVTTRNTKRFRNNAGSRFLQRYPYVKEVVYWALIYWIYQIGRAITALTLKDSTVDVARTHGIFILKAEEAMGFAWEKSIQQWFLRRPEYVIDSINRLYSFAHIPVSVAFFAWLYYTESHSNFAAVRRTLALANALAFVVFTAWPCMPPRLLPAAYGFVDTVHKNDIASVWTSNRFCNELAAMPSLHFGYSAIIGLSLFVYLKAGNGRFNWLGLLYPVLILIAIVSTANHYILDAIVGLMVALTAYRANRLMLNLLVVEDFLLYAAHLHKPTPGEDETDARSPNAEDQAKWIA